MNMDTRTNEENLALFSKLDQSSKNVREAAGDMVNFFMKIDNKPKELTLLIETLKQIKTENIQHFDDLIQVLNNNLLLVNLKINADPGFTKSIAEEDVKAYFKKSETLLKETSLLLKKALELNEK